jgi:predicted RNA methylase
VTTIDREPQLPTDLIPIQYHFNMLNHAARMTAFRDALDLVVQPGMRVVDLGGGTGVLSWFAVRSGAERVWCVERLPALAGAARRVLTANPGGERVTVVNTDAETFLPPEPVDVVVCEMLHVGLLRERQVDVIASFKRRYLERFGLPLPLFVPEATFQAVQPVQQDFSYHGYVAPVPVFQEADDAQSRTTTLGPPTLFQSFTYDGELPAVCAFDDAMDVTADGELNAVRFITKNVLAISVAQARSIDWFMSYLVMPVDVPFAVQTGDRPAIRFTYRPGDELPALESGLRVRL